MKALPITRPSKKANPTSVLFAIAAVAYVGYRTFSLFGLGGIANIVNRPVQAVQIGCSEQVDQELPNAQDRLPNISSTYQDYLYSLPSESANLIGNASLDTVSKRSKLPVDYSWSQDADYLRYAYERDQETNIPYLRVTTKQAVTSSRAPGSWLPTAIPIEPDATYVYSLSYRSSTPVSVIIEYKLPDGKLTYESVTTLANMPEWQRFTYYVHNTQGATAFRFMLAAREQGTVDTRDYDTHRIADARLKKGIVSIAFDDGWQSIATHALPLLAKYHIPTTQYVITEASAKAVPDYMTIDTLQTVKQQGHEIGSHTLTHCDQTELDNTEVLANATESKALLERKGLGPVTTYAYPYGAYDDNTEPLVARAYSYARTSDMGYNDRFYDKQAIRSMVVTNTTPAQTIQEWLDFAAKHRVWLVITYHRVDEGGRYSISSQQLEEQLRLITKSGLEIKPVSVAARSIGN